MSEAGRAVLFNSLFSNNKEAQIKSINEAKFGIMDSVENVRRRPKKYNLLQKDKADESVKTWQPEPLLN